MGFYDNHILPHIINVACSAPPIMDLRQKVVPHCEGRVLEVGMGSGINLALYNPDKVDMVWGLEPSEGMRRKAQKNLDAAAIDVEWLGLPGEEIPLDDDSADTVLLTYTLCTIPDYAKALGQMRRVLKPGGKLLFCEHGASPDADVLRWQNRINPLWNKVAGGCNINRDMRRLISEAGFGIEQIDQCYIEKTPRIAGFMSWGSASKN